MGRDCCINFTSNCEARGGSFALKDWIHGSMWEDFRGLVQGQINSAAYSNISPSANFGTMLVHCPSRTGKPSILSAQSTMLELPTEEGGTSEDGSEEDGRLDEGFLLTLRLQDITELSRS